MRSFIRYIVLFLLISVYTGSVLAVTRAVVIGISDYQDEGIPDLKFADRDARAFANWLHLPGGKNLDPDNIVLLLNEDATLGKVAVALDWLIKDGKPDDQAIIYFSGHGDMESELFGMGHLLLWDSPAKAYIAGGLPVERLQLIVSALSVKKENKVLLVTDACHSGKLAGNEIVGAKLTNANLSTQFSNEQKILSCQPDEYSIEGEQWGGGRGAFSFHLINGLCGLADENNDQNITLLEIEHYLQDRVPPEVEPLSQMPMTVGDKAEIVGRVDEEMLAMLEKGEDLPIQSFSRVEQRGVVEDVLASVDTSIVQLYNAFNLALDEKRLLEPRNDCAETYYEQLIRIDSIAPLHNFLRRNLAATFQDDAQQAINAYLLADQEELNRLSRWDDKYRLYPLYLEKAAELLGPENQFYQSLVARQKYFEGLYLRLFFDVVNTDTLFNLAVQKLQESLELEPNAPYVYVELGLLFDRRLEKDTAESYFLQAIERSPSWIVPYIELQDIYRYNGYPDDFYDRFKNAFPLLESKAGPYKWRVYAMQSVISNVFDKVEEAEQLVKASMEMEGVADWPWYHWGSTLRGRGRLAESEAILEEAMERYPDLAASYWEMAMTKYEMGKKEEFETLFDKALYMAPHRAYDHLTFCSYLMNDGRAEKALEVLERLFQLDPDYHSRLSNHSGIGTVTRIYEQLGQPDKVKLLKGLKLHEAIPEFRDLFDHYGSLDASEEVKEKCRQIREKYDLQAFDLYNMGQAFYLDKEAGLAESVFTMSLEMEPNNINLVNELACWYLIHGGFSQSEKYFQYGLNIRKEDMLYANLSLLYYLEGEYRKALELATEANIAFPEQPFYYEMQVICISVLGTHDNPKILFEEVDRKFPGFMKVWDFIQHYNRGAYQDAVSTWKEIPNSFFHIFYLLPEYIASLIGSGNQDEVMTALNFMDRFGGYPYNTLVGDPALEPLRQMDEYQTYMHAHFPEKYDDAVPVGDTVVTGAPYSANFNRLMGLYYRFHDEYKKAIAYFLESLKTAPDNGPAKVYLADLYLKTENYEAAAEILPEVMVSDGLEANWVAGEVYYRLKQPEKAQAHFREFVRLSYDSRYPNNRVGSFYRVHGDFEMAEIFLKEDLRLHPDDKTFPPSDCRCETNLLKKDIRLHPTNLTSRLNLALVYFFSNQTDQSFELLEASIKKEPGQLSLQALLAFLHYLDDPEAAESYFSKANAIAPGFSQLWNDLELMRNDQYEQADRAWQDAQDRFTDWWMEIVKFQYLQMKIRQGKMEQAMDVFSAILEKGVFVNYQFFESQQGWERFRELPAYGKLMRRYFPEKY